MCTPRGAERPSSNPLKVPDERVEAPIFEVLRAGSNVGLQGTVASIVYNNGGRVRGFIPGYIETRGVYGPTYGAEYTVSNNYYKYFEMNHIVEAFIVLPGGIDTMEGLFTLISWASEGLHSKPIGLLNIDGYFNNLIKFLDDAVRQNFMALNQRKLFISSFFVDELLDKLEFANAFPGPGASYDEFANPGRDVAEDADAGLENTNSMMLDMSSNPFIIFSGIFFVLINDKQDDEIQTMIENLLFVPRKEKRRIKKFTAMKIDDHPYADFLSDVKTPKTF
ncbi:hypothetical protein DM860_012321 [Cuscuta australis]|uniref:cytokinin riboside 5'-monophosphate phosphoribohydrolase n=1 Tax=Cuscuta australis TaxID=267555 RepID=A0A328DQI7_9ASTE|nr:hypothetical protein DM860_012321 [Cuscuta australis]